MKSSYLRTQDSRLIGMLTPIAVLFGTTMTGDVHIQTKPRGPSSAMAFTICEIEADRRIGPTAVTTGGPYSNWVLDAGCCASVQNILRFFVWRSQSC